MTEREVGALLAPVWWVAKRVYVAVVAVGILGQAAVVACILPLVALELLGVRGDFLRWLGL